MMFFSPPEKKIIFLQSSIKIFKRMVSVACIVSETFRDIL
jgi:hypothetical protein